MMQTVGEALVDLGLDEDPFLAAARAGKWWHFGAGASALSLAALLFVLR